MVQHFQDLQPEDEEKSKGEKAGNLLSGNVWKVEQLLTVETRTYLMMFPRVCSTTAILLLIIWNR